jgi:single-strand DNA-binding protein
LFSVDVHIFYRFLGKSMSSVNKVILIGNVGKEPTIIEGKFGKIVRISLATTYKGKTVTETEWHSITFFDKLAEIVEKYVAKGSKLYVEGRIKTETFTNKEQQEVKNKVIIAQSMQLLDSKSESNSHDMGNTTVVAPMAGLSGRTAQLEEEDLPF